METKKKLLRGTLKHWVAILLDWVCGRIDAFLHWLRLKLYTITDYAMMLNEEADEDLKKK